MGEILPSWQPAVVVRFALMSVLMASLLLGARTASAQTIEQKIDTITAQMKHLQDVSAKMPASAKNSLSSSAHRLLHMAENWDKIAPQLMRTAATYAGSVNTRLSSTWGKPLPPGAVSDPSTDTLSRAAGFVQFETSTAWCGNTVVVGYYDTGSFLETLPLLTTGLSANGYSRSTDGGRTFVDQGYVNPGPLFNGAIFDQLAGSSVVTCSDESTFYESSLLGFAGVTVSKSTDGGRTFGDPVPVVLNDVYQLTYYQSVDKPWMAVDPTNPNVLYVTYTRYDVEGFYPNLFPNATCPNNFRLGIDLVTSKDGGATWSTPTPVEKNCFRGVPGDHIDRGSTVAVDGRGNVFVAWEASGEFLPSTNEIDIAMSSNGGVSFSPKVVAVANVVSLGPLSYFPLLQGDFFNNEYPSLAVDRSLGPRRGSLYLAWNDGRNGVAPQDALGFSYHFGDILVIRSDDGGATWSAPIKVNDDIGAVIGIDHYQPGIAVSFSGAVGACWYDRRRDPHNFLIDRECATSRDGGKTWLNTQITQRNFSPIVNEDVFFVGNQFLGDYDGVTADFLGKNDGFLGAYSSTSKGNPDARISRRFGGSDDSGSLDPN